MLELGRWLVLWLSEVLGLGLGVRAGAMAGAKGGALRYFSRRQPSLSFLRGLETIN